MARAVETSRRAGWIALFVLASGCSQTSLAPPPEPFVEPTVSPGPPATPLRIVAGTSRKLDPASFAVARSIAAVAHDNMPYVAQARYCWPSFRVQGEVDDFDKRAADYVLAQGNLAVPPRCTPEPTLVTRRIAELRANAFHGSTAAPPSAMQLFIGAMGLWRVDYGLCTGAVRHAHPRDYARRWRSDVRIQRTGDPTIDGAFATIIADPRFVAAMNGVKVSLVTGGGNVLTAQSVGFGSIDDPCRDERKPFCSRQDAAAQCLRNSSYRTHEALARRATGGRFGYFSNASDFETSRPLAVGVGGFTVGTEREIIGAVCIGLGRVTQAPPARQPGSPEQAVAATCLLRALGVAGLPPPPMGRFAGQRGSQVLQLSRSNGNGATLSADAFTLLRFIYGRNPDTAPARQ